MQTDQQTAAVNILAELEREAERVNPELGDRWEIVTFVLLYPPDLVSYLI